MYQKNFASAELAHEQRVFSVIRSGRSQAGMAVAKGQMIEQTILERDA